MIFNNDNKRFAETIRKGKNQIKSDENRRTKDIDSF